MCEAIKCIRCGAVSYNEYGKTPLTCNSCYAQLQQQIATLERIINMAGGSPPPANLRFTDILLPIQSKIETLEGENKGLRLKNCDLSKVSWDCAVERKQLQAELEKHRWIPVSERLPEASNHSEAIGHSENVWCYNKLWRIPYWVDCYDTKYKIWLVSGKCGATHWKPITLPTAEKENEKNGKL